MSERALLVVDMLNDFMDPDGSLFCGPASRAIIPVIAGLLERHRREGSAIIFVKDSHLPDDKEFELFPPHCLSGEPGSEIIPELAPLAGETVLPKSRYSAFFNTGLDKMLRDKGVAEVHLCGVCTSICVMDTCSDLRNRDYTTIVHVAAVADFDSQAHEFSLKRMRNILGARLV